MHQGLSREREAQTTSTELAQSAGVGCYAIHSFPHKAWASLETCKRCQELRSLQLGELA